LTFVLFLTIIIRWLFVRRVSLVMHLSKEELEKKYEKRYKEEKNPRMWLRKLLGSLLLMSRKLIE
jgi:hypothetical protein